MKNRPIHENLDTSFVNLSALLRYLRRRQFAGSIRVELSGYEADIVLTSENQLNVREYDRIAGRIAEGEEALQRLLIRAREPGGIIHVYQRVAETESVHKQKVKTQNTEIPIPKPDVKLTTPTVAAEANKPVAEGEKAVANGNSATLKTAPVKTPVTIKTIPAANGNAPKIEIVKQPVIGKFTAEKTEKPKSALPDFPFQLSNNFEAKARKNRLSAEEWQTLLNLTGELLKTVDECLAKARLDFTAAFEKAGAEVAADYPFLNPKSEVFFYKHGKIGMREQTNPKIFVAGINETLRRILDKLAASPKFAEVHRYAVHKIIALIHARKPLYDKFSFTPPLEKILGI